ncbi:YrdB family protein [Planosporangium thailandense]|uniref:YrdB family protein n=1 Tax=Planosporangium thailandense TaxID=765197 RepID=A0ABX0XXX3_9ACTN|nr:YrdB family protein [Planosporangium thailandense]NJC70891.1 YrdB family protein [Planosporangium thailandense]
MRPANLALRFALELAGLVAFGYWGFVTPTGRPLAVLLGLGAPLVAAALWGVLAAPKAPVRLPGAARLGFEIVWFGAAAAALIHAGRPFLAVVLAALYAVNRVLMYVWRQ